MKPYKFKHKDFIITIEAPRHHAINFINTYYKDFQLCNDSNTTTATSDVPNL